MSLLSNKTLRIALAAGVVALAAAGLATVTPAFAQRGGDKAQGKTPEGWSYEIRNGQRVPRGNRVTNPDGSWREEIRDGNCTTVRTMSAGGEYRESRQC
jgi:hypothetical protein